MTSQRLPRWPHSSWRRRTHTVAGRERRTFDKFGLRSAQRCLDEAERMSRIKRTNHFAKGNSEHDGRAQPHQAHAPLRVAARTRRRAAASTTANAVERALRAVAASDRVVAVAAPSWRGVSLSGGSYVISAEAALQVCSRQPLTMEGRGESDRKRDSQACFPRTPPLCLCPSRPPTCRCRSCLRSSELLIASGAPSC